MKFDKPIVLSDDISEIMRLYSLGGILESSYLGGVPNVTYKVVTNSGAYAVRITNHGYTSVEHLKIEVELLRHLAKRSFAESPRLTLGVDGEAIQSWRGYRVLVTEFISGTPGDRVKITADLCHDVGRVVASLKKHLSAFTGKVPEEETFVRRGKRLLSILPATTQNLGWEIDVGSILDQWKYATHKFDEYKDLLQFSVLHSDVWPPNIICESNRIIGVVDFDDWCYGPTIIDVCGPIVEFPMISSNVLNDDLCIAFFLGYLSNGGTISDVEENLIVYGMEMTCISWLACNALHKVQFDESEIYLKKLNYLRNETSRKQLSADIMTCIHIARAKIK